MGRSRLAGAVAALVLLVSCQAKSARELPTLGLMTGLPLFWGDGNAADIIQGRSGPQPIITQLAKSFQLVPTDQISAETLKQVQLLMLAQPPALRPEELVALDDWVKVGGRLIIFADPALAWPSALPMGDPRRPPVRSLLNPLFTHWGVTLSSGAQRDGAPRRAILLGKPATLVEAGQWQSASPNCSVRDEALVMSCTIGKGRVTLIADADMLDLEQATRNGTDNAVAIIAIINAVFAGGG